MISASFFAPVAAALTLAILVTTLHRRLSPQAASRVVAATVLVVAAAALPTLWILSIGFLAHLPFAGSRFAWCTEALGMHDQLPSWLGVPTTVVASVGTVRAVRMILSQRRLRHDQPGSVEIADHDRPFAVTLPGRGGHIIVSSALIELLDDDEQHVVIAHEEAHARHRHDRYLLLAQTCSASIPLLRPLTSRLQFSIERWADEAAVQACGDRGLVARTLGKVALNAAAPAGLLGFAGLGVPARMAALLQPAPRPTRRPQLAGLNLAIGVTAVMGVIQLHHLAGLLTALCPG